MAKKLTVLIALNDIDDKKRDILQNACEDIDIRTGPWLDDIGQKLPTELMKGVDVLLCEMPPENFDDFDQLKLVQVTSAGYSQLFDLGLVEKGIKACNSLGNFDAPIAEWNIMMMLVWHRSFLELLQNQKDKTWDRSAKFQTELRGSLIGFYGYGGVARQTARLAKNMGLKIWALDRTDKPERRDPDKVYCLEGTGDPDGTLPDRFFSAEQTADFLPELDYLIISTSLTSATEGIIGERQLRMLKPSAVLINPARAKIIQEQAYIKCLSEGWIRGSSLDVHYAYPLPPEHPLWSMPNLISTPHISGSAGCPYFFDRVYDIFSQNLKRLSTGQPLLNELTKSQLMGQ